MSDKKAKTAQKQKEKPEVVSRKRDKYAGFKPGWVTKQTETQK